MKIKFVKWFVIIVMVLNLLILFFPIKKAVDFDSITNIDGWIFLKWSDTLAGWYEVSSNDRNTIDDEVNREVVYRLEDFNHRMLSNSLFLSQNIFAVKKGELVESKHIFPDNRKGFVIVVMDWHIVYPIKRSDYLFGEVFSKSSLTLYDFFISDYWLIISMVAVIFCVIYSSRSKSKDSIETEAITS